MQPTPPCSAPTCWWQMWVSRLLLCWELLLRHVICGFCLFIYFSSWLCCPLRFQNSPQTLLWEGFLVFGNFSFKTPSWDRSPPLTLLSLFLSFIFCPTFFWRQWAAFLDAWCPLPAFRSCFVEFAQRSVFFWWIFGGESGLPVLFLCHLRTAPLPLVFSCVWFSAMSDSLQPHGLQHSLILCPWDFLGMITGVGS